MDKYLPIGSVVLLEGGTKRVMIYGRKQQELNTNKIWDYIACLYPEGNINEQYMYLFNHDQIEKIYFIGYQDEEEFEFVKENLSEND
ncbi:DUF4176 domain-containing protein [Neobacillus sp. OS1-2]|uniref:DUF4176 domain-containing protein n=1 Tax=Neobacillus sp. OS1-2 TaxID=3070680 RepID=UPI0027E09010|nr:DUF4176 domain-containing protein [Neobacillus sp. OS1-2]WML41342.1 DUF4176 domain-containing protein [Neobacillus sp. OS1-2]